MASNIASESCLLGQTDSSTAAGWLKKSNFADKLEEAVQLTIAHQLANILTKTKSCLYSQWFPGEFNTVSDSLSRDFHLPPETLSNSLSLHVPEQVPFVLTIHSLPTEIIFWLTSLLCNQLQREPWLKAPMPSKFALGIETSGTYFRSASMTTCTSTISPREQSTRPSASLLSPSEKGRFCPRYSKNLKAESVRATLDCVAQTHKLADRADPRLDIDGKFAFLLQRQLRGYSSTNPPTTPQVAIKASILRKFYQMSISPADKALCELFSGTFFFVMRSCEYVKVSGKQKTKLLTLKNIRFLKGRRTLNHSDPCLHLADCVTITFELQKRDAKTDMITQHRSSDPTLCPVKVRANIIRRVNSYPSSSKDTPVNSFLLLNNKIHSAWSGAAMAMYLAGVPVFTIMLLGRWSSDAFLR